MSPYLYGYNTTNRILYERTPQDPMRILLELEHTLEGSWGDPEGILRGILGGS